FANTYTGFNQALLHLRDVYAPNVLLAFHVSDWATRYDVGSSTDTTLDWTALGNQAGAFAGAAGVTQPGPGTSSYDLVFNDLAELQQTGVIGLLFGRGNGGSTTNDDDKADGITNSPSFCTTDGVSSGTVCNSHASTVSDDDGGYLRTAAANYYTSPLPIDGTP